MRALHGKNQRQKHGESEEWRNNRAYRAWQRLRRDSHPQTNGRTFSIIKIVSHCLIFGHFILIQ
jgi:hypothetical protein